MSKLIKFYIILICLILFVAIYGHYNFEINRTHSLPLGIYHINSSNIIQRNNIVVFCPPYNEFLKYAKKKGYFGTLELVCDNNTPKYMKKAVGLPGDDIYISLSGVYINKRKIKRGFMLRWRNGSLGRALMYKCENLSSNPENPHQA